ncbi:MAG: hypothetical protein AUK48_04315 [Oscillatoriales cyanobacterium CG2_30_44_21]|nr:MAG: hypothetical protein AUK48_04315 [Oscillatoriales cyanobacterium CG2_30_44_21]
MIVICPSYKEGIFGGAALLFLQKFLGYQIAERLALSGTFCDSRVSSYVFECIMVSILITFLRNVAIAPKLVIID